MTSSSRRKPRTTRRSTPSPNDLRAAAALAVGLLCCLPASAADWRGFLRSPPEPLSRPPFAIVAPAVAEDAPPESAAGPVSPAEAAAEEPAAFLPAETAPVVAAPAEPPAAALVAAAEPTRTGGPCGQDAEGCRDALEALRADSLDGIDIDIRVAGQPGSSYPCECRLEGETFRPRRFAATTFTWKAAGYCHKPLYFEHWNLERYGHSHGFVADSFTSAAHFFVTLPVLPYKMGVELPWECVYPLGYYRPGSCAPWTVPAPPISGRGLAVQAATVTGLVFLLP